MQTIAKDGTWLVKKILVLVVVFDIGIILETIGKDRFSTNGER